jgi:thiamine kinase-like enzyme
MSHFVNSILDQIPRLRCQNVSITPLAGGMTNHIYKVNAGSDAFVLRIFGHGTAILGIDRNRELACLKAIAAAGLGAEVVAYLPELNPPPFDGFCGALLVRFLKRDLLKPEQVQNPDMLRRIGESLRQCHAAPIDANVGVFSVFDTIRDYLDKARARNVQLPAEWTDALAHLQRIENELTTEEPLCLCHNDLLAGNFVDDGATLRIIDWEYGGRGNRYFDLGNFAVNLQLTDEQERAFLQAYFGEARPADLRRLELMRLASDLREASWGYLQQAISKIEPPKEYGSFANYGKKHLQRMLTAI